MSRQEEELAAEQLQEVLSSPEGEEMLVEHYIEGIALGPQNGINLREHMEDASHNKEACHFCQLMAKNSELAALARTQLLDYNNIPHNVSGAVTDPRYQ